MSGFQLPGEVIKTLVYLKVKESMDRPSLSDIANRVAAQYRIEKIVVHDQSRKGIKAREEFLKLACRECRYKQQVVADFLGYRHRSTLANLLNRNHKK